MTAERAYVIRRHDGKYFQGCGYGGPGNPVPYWTEDIREAQTYRSVPGARKAAQRWGGYVGLVEVDAAVIRWLGFLVWQRQMWKALDVAPADFDPNDYEGNNGPTGAFRSSTDPFGRTLFQR